MTTEEAVILALVLLCIAFFVPPMCLGLITS